MSAGSGTLAKQYVEFLATGLTELQDGLNVVRGNLSSVDDAGKAMGEHITGEFSGMTSKLISAKADRKSTRLNSSHMSISYAVFCLKKKIFDEAAFNYTLIDPVKFELQDCVVR